MPPRLGLVSHYTVELHDNAVFRVPDVGVLAGATPDRHRLPISARQAVLTFDIPEISQFKWGMDACPDLGDGVV